MSHHSTPTMTASWTTGESPDEDMTVAQCGPLGAFDLEREALDDDMLDANALFSDLPPSYPPPSYPPPEAEPQAVFHASPYLALPAPSPVAPIMTTVRRSNAPTLRVRRAQRNLDSLQARAGAIAVCGLLALVATLVACFLYVAAPHRARHAEASAPRTTHVPATVAASALVTASAPTRAEAPADIELDAPAAPAAAGVAHARSTPTGSSVAQVSFAIAAPSAPVATAAAKTSAQKTLDDVLLALGEEQLRR